MGRSVQDVRLIGVIVLSATLAACSTAAQRQAQVIRSNDHAALATVKACEQVVYNSPDFAPIQRHFPAPGGGWTLEQLTDSSLATDEEIKAFFVIHPKMNVCRQQFLNELLPATPSFVPILATEYSRAEDNLVVLVRKKETWGDYAGHAKGLQDETRSQLVTEGQRIDAGLERSHEAELARRQSAVAAIAQYAQTQEAINAMSRPVVTTCNAYANSATCVTR